MSARKQLLLIQTRCLRSVAHYVMPLAHLSATTVLTAMPMLPSVNLVSIVSGVGNIIYVYFVFIMTASFNLRQSARIVFH